MTKKDASVVRRKLSSILEMYYLKQAKEARLDLSSDNRPCSTARACSDRSFLDGDVRGSGEHDLNLFKVGNKQSQVCLDRSG